MIETPVQTRRRIQLELASAVLRRACELLENTTDPTDIRYYFL